MNEESKELTNWEKELANQAVEVSAKERPQVSAISLRSGILSYEGTAYPDNQLDCIVVAHCLENRWYKGVFDADNIESPECFAIEFEQERMAPHPNARPPLIAVKEGETTDVVTTTCKGCSKNEWGSDPRPSSRGKACKEIRRLAIIPYGDFLNPENVPDSEMAIIKLPVTSVKNWSNYVNKVGAGLKRPPWSVITNVKLVPDPKTQFKVIFDCKGAVDSAFLGALNAKREAVLPALTAPYDPPTTSDSYEDSAESTKY